MTETIDVKPGLGKTTVPVAIDLVDDIAYPLYKPVISEDGETPVHVSPENPLPVSISVAAANADLLQRKTIDAIDRLTAQVKLSNLYLSAISDVEFDADDVT